MFDAVNNVMFCDVKGIEVAGEAIVRQAKAIVEEIKQAITNNRKADVSIRTIEDIEAEVNNLMYCLEELKKHRK